MKRILSIGLGALFLLLGLAVVPSLLYNLCGIARVPDCSDAPRWESALVSVFLIAFIGMAFIASLRRLRAVFPQKAECRRI